MAGFHGPNSLLVAGFGGPNSLLVADFHGPGLAGFAWPFFHFCGWFSWPLTIEVWKLLKYNV